MKSIFLRIYLAFLATSIIAVSVTILLAFFYRQWTNDFVNLVAPTGGYISTAELSLQYGGEPLLVEWLLTFERHPSVNAYAFDESGASLTDHVPAEVIRYALSPETYQAQIDSFSASEVLVKSPIVGNDNKIYLLVVEFVHPLKAFHLPASMGLGLVAAFALFAAMGWVISSYLVRPLRELQASVRTFAIKDWALSIPAKLVRRSDEIGALSREFSYMSERIQSLMSAQKRLLSDVSHELRSPLARMAVATELAKLDAPDEQLEYLARIEMENQRLNDMVGQLLEVAKLESQLTQKTWKKFEFDQMITGVVNDAQFEYGEGRIELFVPRGIMVNGDVRLLHSAFENMIRNALVHTPKDCLVTISVKFDDLLHVRIRDRGPGVPPNMLKSLLEPFVRSDDARERSPNDLKKGHQGFGLGLAIANSVISHHKGSLELSNHPDGGLCIDVSLPMSRL